MTANTATSLSARTSANTAPARHAGFDALRGWLTLLVILHHTAITYGAIGGWYYRERATDAALSTQLLVFFCTVNQAFFMGLFFLLAGYFTPGALQRKGALRFMLERLWRLGLPLLIFGFVLGPITIALARTAQGQGFIETLLRLWRAGVFDSGPLWFAQALLLFCAATVLLQRGLPAAVWPRIASACGPGWPSRRALAWAALLTGVAALALRSQWPVGVNLWGLQLGYFASYSLLFAFGCLAAPQRWLEHLPADSVRHWRRVSRWALPVLPAVYFLGQAWPLLQGAVLDVAYAFWEPLVAWGLILALLQRFGQPGAAATPRWPALARRAYAMYILHPPVLVAVALAWRGVPAPALLKFAVTGALASLLCFVVAGWLLRWRPLQRLL